MTAVELQFSGYLNTPVLWRGDHPFGLKQFELTPLEFPSIKVFDIPKLRLGKLVERFVSFELKQHADIAILQENIQINHNKLTVGELDCILVQNNQLIHLEIVYKFYLFDPKTGNTEIEHWIGPNRKDSMIEKLTKLKEKQLPLLFYKNTKTFLQSLNISTENIKQYVYFKAQLFIPLNLKTKPFKHINPDCIVGFYMSKNQLQLEQFKFCKFFIPTKINWLQPVQLNTHWLTHSKFAEKLDAILLLNTSPLCWIKYPNGVTEKCFIIWWD